MAATASAPLRGLCEEALCSICLEYFEDPATTECGHSFCRACLTRCWEGSEGSEEVSCPQCRGKVRRNFIPNRQLANFVELTRKLRLQEETSMEGNWGVCERHQEPLRLFCKEDMAPLCVVCKWSKQHQEHQMASLEEAAQDCKDLISRRLELLGKERTKVLACKAETEEESQELLKQTKAEAKKTIEQFREFHSFLSEQENLLLAQLEELEKAIVRNREEQLDRLSEELSSLGSLIQEMEQKHQQPPSELLQDVRSILQRYEEKVPFQNPLAVPPELMLRFQYASNKNTFLAKKIQQFRATLLSGFQFQKANVALDPKTAHRQLILSRDCKSVRCENKSQRLPNNPERFSQYTCVVGCKGFTTGRHYWDIAVGNEGSLAVGVARKSVERKGGVAFRPSGGIWAVERWGGKYWRVTDPLGESFLPLRGNPRRIRVSLNCEEGWVSFHDAHTESHIYTFTGASSSGETLLPFFYVTGKVSLSIL